MASRFSRAPIANHHHVCSLGVSLNYMLRQVVRLCSSQLQFRHTCLQPPSLTPDPPSCSCGPPVRTSPSSLAVITSVISCCFSFQLPCCCAKVMGRGAFLNLYSRKTNLQENSDAVMQNRLFLYSRNRNLQEKSDVWCRTA